MCGICQFVQVYVVGCDCVLGIDDIDYWFGEIFVCYVSSVQYGVCWGVGGIFGDCVRGFGCMLVYCVFCVVSMKKFCFLWEWGFLCLFSFVLLDGRCCCCFCYLGGNKYYKNKYEIKCLYVWLGGDGNGLNGVCVWVYENWFLFLLCCIVIGLGCDCNF